MPTSQVHLRVKNVTDYTGPESYVKDMLSKNDFSFFPILKTSSIIVEDVRSLALSLPAFPPCRTQAPTSRMHTTRPSYERPVGAWQVSNEVLLDRVNDLSKQLTQNTERVEAQLEAQRSEMLEQRAASQAE